MKTNLMNGRTLRMGALVTMVTIGAVGAAMAQSSQEPATRASVKADLVNLESTGYQPSNDNRATYPSQLQAAEKIANPATGPQYSVAQTGQTQPVTRASAEADLARLEQAGYRPDEDRINYPNNLQAAERKVGDIGNAQ